MANVIYSYAVQSNRVDKRVDNVFLTTLSMKNVPEIVK